jgi:energy-coupling factor transport system permease protein
VLVTFVIFIGEGRAYVRWLRLSLPMAVFFGAVTWWTADWKTGLMAALALLIIISIFFVFFSTTAPEDLGNSLVKIGLPYPVAFVFSTALQFVPVISRKARNVLDAQRSRGIPLEPGWSALRHYPAFLGPLLIQAFQLAEELAAAMEARGFGRPGRTFYRDYRMGPADWSMIAATLLLASACFISQRI